MIAFRTSRLLARPAGPDDVAALQGVLVAAPGYHELCGESPPGPGAGADLLADAEADPERALLLLWPATAGLAPASGAAGLVDLQLHWPEPGAVHVRLLLLRESAQGRGLGREATLGLEGALREAGFRALRLSVTVENEGARLFWERVGFGAVDRRGAGDTLHEKLL